MRSDESSVAYIQLVAVIILDLQAGTQLEFLVGFPFLRF